jgi:hypothetical protein
MAPNSPLRPLPPAVIVHGPGDVARALAAGRPLVLLSAPGAALYAGAGWWRALVSTAHRRAPALLAADILDCADAAGRALAALRIGQRLLVLDHATPAHASVAAAAAVIGATLLDTPPPALDLAAPAAARRLEAWLARDDTDAPLG